MTTLGHRIVYVVGLCPHEQVSGITARRIIARVADLEAGRNRAEVHHPANSAGDDLAAFLGDPDTAMLTGRAHGTYPDPAIGALLNLLPEPLSERT